MPCERQSAEIRSTGRPQHRFHFFPLWQGHGPLREGGAGIGRGIAAEGLGAGRERLALAHRLRAFLRAAAVFLALLAWPPLRPICRMASRSSSGFIAGENAKRLACVNDGVGERSAQQVQTGFRTTQFVLIWVIDEPRGFASLNPERPRWRGAASLRDARGLADRGRTLRVLSGLQSLGRSQFNGTGRDGRRDCGAVPLCQFHMTYIVGCFIYAPIVRLFPWL